MYLDLQDCISNQRTLELSSHQSISYYSESYEEINSKFRPGGLTWLLDELTASFGRGKR